MPKHFDDLVARAKKKHLEDDPTVPQGEWYSHMNAATDVAKSAIPGEKIAALAELYSGNFHVDMQPLRSAVADIEPPYSVPDALTAILDDALCTALSQDKEVAALDAKRIAASAASK